MKNRIDELLKKLKVETELIIPTSYSEESVKEIMILELCEKAFSQRYEQLCYGVKVDRKLKLKTYNATAYILTEFDVRSLIRYARLTK